MCIITLEFNQSNALARRKLAALLATGLFVEKDFKPEEPTPEQVHHLLEAQSRQVSIHYWQYRARRLASSRQHQAAVL